MSTRSPNFESRAADCSRRVQLRDIVNSIINRWLLNVESFRMLFFGSISLMSSWNDITVRVLCEGEGCAGCIIWFRRFFTSLSLGSATCWCSSQWRSTFGCLSASSSELLWVTSSSAFTGHCPSTSPTNIVTEDANHFTNFTLTTSFRIKGVPGEGCSTP